MPSKASRRSVKGSRSENVCRRVRTKVPPLLSFAVVGGNAVAGNFVARAGTAGHAENRKDQKELGRSILLYHRVSPWLTEYLSCEVGNAGGGKGAAIGAGVGAVGGLIAKKMSKGPDAEVKSGTEFGVILNKGISLPRYN